MNIAPIILCGGVGKRLFPFSSYSLPKQFIVLFADGESFFQKTVRRVRYIFKVEKIIIVANKMHKELLLQQLKEINENNVLILFERCSKNTFMSLAVAGMIASADVDVFAVFPSDHFILDKKSLRQDMLSAVQVSVRECKHMLFGIEPTKFDNNYGYIQISNRRHVDNVGEEFLKVSSFVEKPNIRFTKMKLQSHKCYWNSGIFVFNNKILTNDDKHQTKIKVIKNNISVKKDDVFLEIVAKKLSVLSDTSIDQAILEGNKQLLCKKASFDWQDIGNFASLSELMKKKYITFSIPKYIQQCEKYSANN